MIGSLGVPELMFILGLALLIFGPRKLPEVGRTLGRAMSEFRKASTELRRTLNTEVLEEEIRKEKQQLNDAIRGKELHSAPDVARPDAAKDQPSEKKSDDASSETKAAPAQIEIVPTAAPGAIARGSDLAAGGSKDGDSKDGDRNDASNDAAEKGTDG